MIAMAKGSTTITIPRSGVVVGAVVVGGKKWIPTTRFVQIVMVTTPVIVVIHVPTVVGKGILSVVNAMERNMRNAAIAMAPVM